MLRSLSKVINQKDSESETFCIGNTSRPLLSHGPKGSKGSRKTFLYVEALKRFKALIPEVDLSEAYKKARPMYDGRMEHTFVVLKENQDSVASGSNQEPLGNKRPAGDDGAGSSKRKNV